MKTIFLILLLTSLTFAQSFEFMASMGDDAVPKPKLQLNGKETSITVTLSNIKDSAKVYRDSVYVHTFTSNGSWVDTPLVVGGYGYYAMNYFKGDTSKYSDEITDYAYPKIPTISVAGDIAKITVTNAEASIGDSLRIYRGTSTNPTTWVYSIAPNTSKIDSPLTEGSIYFYRARTLTNGVLSDYSANVSDTANKAFTFALTCTATGNIVMKGTGAIDVYWGDGLSNIYTLNGVDQDISHTYSGVGTYKVMMKYPSRITKFSTTANDAFSFDLSQLQKTGLTNFNCQGSNTITGNLSSLPSGLTSFTCVGSNTITGNLSSLPSGLTSFTCVGSNTITGNLSSLPSGLTNFNCQGSNTITGNLSSLPSGLTYFNCQGSNTITGNLSSLPSGLTSFYCTGSNTTADYTSGRTWANNMRQVYIRQAATYGFSSTEVDNLLIDLANVAAWSTDKTIDLRGVNAARTSASDAAVTTLLGKGVSVFTN